MFEPVHGSAPPLAGKNVANPMGAILSAALMLEYLGLSDEAAAIEAAVRDAVVSRSRDDGDRRLAGHARNRRLHRETIHQTKNQPESRQSRKIGVFVFSRFRGYPLRTRCRSRPSVYWVVG